MAVRELAPRHRAPERIDDFLGVLKAFALRDPNAPRGSTVSAQFGIGDVAGRLAAVPTPGTSRST